MIKEITLELREFFAEFRMNLEDIIRAWRNGPSKGYYLVFGKKGLRCPEGWVKDGDIITKHQDHYDEDTNPIQAYWSATDFYYRKLLNEGYTRSEIVGTLQRSWEDQLWKLRTIRVESVRTGDIRRPPIYKKVIEFET